MKKEIPGYPNSLLFLEGFVERFFELLPDHKNDREAYEATEGEYELYFEHRKYADFQSFRVTKNRYLSSQTKNTQKHKNNVNSKISARRDRTGDDHRDRSD